MLGAIRYQPNRATLHTDVSLLPANRQGVGELELPPSAGPADRGPPSPTACGASRASQSADELLVTLNRDDAIDPATVLGSFDYAHPVYDAAAVAAQQRQGELNGVQRTWFCGAYWGSGFHEDGVQSARVVCRQLAGEDL